MEHLTRDTYILKPEGLAKLYLYKDDSDSIPSKSMNVFYKDRKSVV